MVIEIARRATDEILRSRPDDAGVVASGGGNSPGVLEIGDVDRLDGALRLLGEPLRDIRQVVVQGRAAALLGQLVGPSATMTRRVLAGVLGELLACTQQDDSVADVPALSQWRAMVGMPGPQLEALVGAPAAGRGDAATVQAPSRRWALRLRRRGDRIEAVDAHGRVHASWQSDHGRVIGLRVTGTERLVVADDPLVHRSSDEHATFLRSAVENGVVVLVGAALPTATERLLPSPVVRALVEGPALGSSWAYEVWLDRVGRAALGRPRPQGVSAVSRVSTEDELRQLVAAVRGQCWPELELVVAGPDELEHWLGAAVENAALTVRPVGDGPGALARAVETARQPLVTVMRAGDLYGMHHVEGLVQRWESSEADVTASEVAAVYRLQSDSTAVGSVGSRSCALAASLGDRSSMYSLLRRVPLDVDSTVGPAGGVSVDGVLNAQYVRREATRRAAEQWLPGGVAELLAGPAVGPGYLRLDDRVGVPQASVFEETVAVLA